jgi:hypothetical protein
MKAWLRASNHRGTSFLLFPYINNGPCIICAIDLLRAEYQLYPGLELLVSLNQFLGARWERRYLKHRLRYFACPLDCA